MKPPEVSAVRPAALTRSGVTRHTHGAPGAACAASDTTHPPMAGREYNDGRPGLQAQHWLRPRGRDSVMQRQGR